MLYHFYIRFSIYFLMFMVLTIYHCGMISAFCLFNNSLCLFIVSNAVLRLPVDVTIGINRDAKWFPKIIFRYL